MSHIDGTDFIKAAAASKRLHVPWVTPPLTRRDYDARVTRMKAPRDYAFLVRRCDSGALVGYIDVTNVVRGPFLSGYVSYYAFEGHQRQGLMTQALRLVTQHAFRNLKLHRLEANIQPENVASIALVDVCGFRKEGYSPRYLKIRGRWRDHERWALLR